MIDFAFKMMNFSQATPQFSDIYFDGVQVSMKFIMFSTKHRYSSVQSTIAIAKSISFVLF